MPWHCYKCGVDILPQHVTHNETHSIRMGGCGNSVLWRDEHPGRNLIPGRDYGNVDVETDMENDLLPALGL